MLAFVAITCGCAHGLTDAPPDAHHAAPAIHTPGLHAVPGEAIEYKVTLRGFTVGHVVVAVGEPGEVDGRRAIVVRSRATGGGFVSMFSSLAWELTTVLLLDSGHALSEEETVDMSMYGQHEHEHQTRELAGDSTLNIHSAAGTLRAWSSKVGDTAAFDVRISDIYLNVALTDGARETVKSFPAVRYDGTATAANTYKLSIWISDDEARVPLALRSQSKWGELAVELESYDVSP